MAQNIYDEPGFFTGYSQLPRSVHGLEAAPEWPTLQAMLPPLRQTRVLDLGCGFGWFCRWARRAGASSVLGIDLSANMLARARADTSDPAIHYEQADLDTITLPPASFDLVYSSLALHYLPDVAALFRKIQEALVPGGSLVFSVEHPIFTAPSRPEWINSQSERHWPLDQYLIEGPRRTDWIAKGVIKHHRTIETYVTALLANGFTLRHLCEWGPSDEILAVHPDWDDDRDRPPFLLIGASR